MQPYCRQDRRCARRTLSILLTVVRRSVLRAVVLPLTPRPLRRKRRLRVH